MLSSWPCQQKQWFFTPDTCGPIVIEKNLSGPLQTLYLSEFWSLSEIDLGLIAWTMCLVYSECLYVRYVFVLSIFSGIVEQVNALFVSLCLSDQDGF